MSIGAVTCTCAFGAIDCSCAGWMLINIVALDSADCWNDSGMVVL
ncbi:Uncharacterised protein [uncultured archaeon]|nr:Uncharacterised protein [uncultured archaeon]